MTRTRGPRSKPSTRASCPRAPGSSRESEARLRVSGLRCRRGLEARERLLDPGMDFEDLREPHHFEELLDSLGQRAELEGRASRARLLEEADQMPQTGAREVLDIPDVEEDLQA